MKKQLKNQDKQLPKTITVHQATDNQIGKQQKTYYNPTLESLASHANQRSLSVDINQQLEQKVSEGTAAIVQIAKELAARNHDLKIANKQLENFAYTVSHDLQEPLRSVNMFTQLLEKEYGEQLDEQAQEYMTYITGSAARMQTLIRDVLNYSRAGNDDQTWLEINLNQLVDTVLIDLQQFIQETDAEIVVYNLPTLLINPTEINQLLRNLISNSLKFRSNQKLRIEIASQLQNGQWLITIKDNGIGIEPQYHSKIFQVFKRLHSQEEYGGSGIGLAICQKIVERHQGQIGVKSQLGKGSTFYFTLPKSGINDRLTLN